MAKFDYNSECAHPTKCKRLMTNFAQDLLNRKVKMEEDNQFATLMATLPLDSIRIYFNYNELMRTSHYYFRKNFHLKVDYTKGFAAVTLSLLHEIGHQKNVKSFPNQLQERIKKLDKITKQYQENKITEEELQFSYFSFPEEVMATQWAIDWLAIKENRQKAKEFEKKFFKAWRGK